MKKTEKVDLSRQARDLFVRKYDDLPSGVRAQDTYEALKLGALLRHLLVDNPPLVHLANRGPRLPIRFRVNRLPRRHDYPVVPDVVIHGLSLDPAVFQSRDGTRDLKLDEFLSLELIETADGAVTAKDIIKFSANKLGAIHLDDSMGEEDRRLLALDARLQSLGLPPIVALLQMVGRLAMAALGELRGALVKLPPALKLVGHYSMRDRLASIAFGGRAFLSTDPFSAECQGGFSWCAAIAIAAEQPRGRRVLYDAQKRRGSSFTISVGPRAELRCSTRFTGGLKLEAVVPDFLVSGLTDAFLPLLCQACPGGTTAQVTIHHGEHLLAVAESKHAPRGARGFTFERQVIGADVNGQRGSRFQVRELVLGNGCLDDRMRRAMAEYFQLQWHA